MRYKRTQKGNVTYAVSQVGWTLKFLKKVCENVLSALNGSSFFVTGLGGEKIDLFLGGDAVNEAPRLWLQETSLPSVFCLPTSSMILKRTVSYRFLRSCSSYVPMIHKR